MYNQLSKNRWKRFDIKFRKKNKINWKRFSKVNLCFLRCSFFLVFVCESGKKVKMFKRIFSNIVLNKLYVQTADELKRTHRRQNVILLQIRICTSDEQIHLFYAHCSNFAGSWYLKKVFFLKLKNKFLNGAHCCIVPDKRTHR